ncbi:N-acetylmuramoyl-L-alanine amidase [Nocardia sp. NPDC056100]|uniref:N-acetylmuramoyl-L-alanine amidase n=1 Tax=Nocardia sp. NPDC056100 TaxID=3345712 RepID=UPI0035D96928
MPYRRTKHSYVLPVVTILAITTPLGILALGDSRDIKPTDASNPAAIPAEMAEVALASAPDLVLPLRELTGMNLPDLHLSDLRMLPLPASIHIPPGLAPGLGLPSEIPLPRLGRPGMPGAGNYVNPGGAPGFIAAPGPEVPGADTGNPSPAPKPVQKPDLTGDLNTPALAPNAVPNELVNKVGAQVKELSRDTPFSMVALTAPELVGTTAYIRAKRSDGGWGPWYDSEAVDTPAKKPGRTGTEPIYVGKTKSVQILVTKKNTGRAVAAPVDPPAAQDVPANPAPEAAPGAQAAPEPAPNAPANPEAQPAPAANPDAQPVPNAPANPDTLATPAQPEVAPFTDHGDPAQINLEKLAAILIDPGRGAADENLNRVAAPLPGGGPKVISRAQWGADESLRCEEPTYDDAVNAITVHHTAGRNDYTASESAGIVRSIYAYHAKTLGWCDIGYNALVDKYGQIFEGRFGGLDRPVEGAHAGGFNINTAGVAFMGNHEEEAPTEEAMQAMGNFIGWRAKVAGIDPEGKTTMYSEGSDYTRYPLGQAVKLPNVFAHRDVGNTTCPGDMAYDLMDRIRSLAENVAGKPSGPPPPQQQRPTQTRPQRNAGNQQQPQSNPSSEADLATLADLTTKLLGMLETSPVAKYYEASGGPNGPMGQAKSEPIATANGGQYAQFVNGYVYSTPDGQAFAVVGKILERFLQLGAGTGALGLPTSGEYPVQDGVRTDFQNGSLIFSQITGIVTTVLKNLGAGQGQGPAPIPAMLGNGQQADPIPAAIPEAAAGQ